MKITLQKLVMLPALMLLTTSIFAQTKLGFKVGMQSASVTSNIPFNGENLLKSIAAPQAALVAEFGLGEHFALQAELNYTARGFKIKEGVRLDIVDIPIDLGTTIETKVNYINLPILAKYKFGKGPIKGYVMAGPELGYAVNGSFKTKARVIVEFTLVEESINLEKVGTQRFDAGAAVGAGMAFDTGRGDFFVDARYARSFTDLVEVPVISIPVKNQGFQFNVGYLFKLSGS